MQHTCAVTKCAALRAGLSVGETAKEIGARWAKLDEKAKAPYQKRAEADKARPPSFVPCLYRGVAYVVTVLKVRLASSSRRIAAARAARPQLRSLVWALRASVLWPRLSRGCKLVMHPCGPWAVLPDSDTHVPCMQARYEKELAAYNAKK